MTNAEKLQAIRNTLGIMQIPNTERNVEMLYGIYRTLGEVQADLMKDEEPQIEMAAAEEVEGDG